MNGLLGTGGGILAVPILKCSGCRQKNAQACTSLFILCTTVVSLTAMLIYGNKIDLRLCLPILLGGIPGSFVGAVLLSKLSNKTLQLLFSILVLVSGLRLLL